MALTVYQVVQGISQAVHNKHHGATDTDGKLVEIGLKREEQPIKDQRVMDGFGISMHGNALIVKYNSIEPLANLKEKRFEKEVERRMEDVKRFIQKEFETVTGSSLRLKEIDEIKVLVETSNRMKAMVKAIMAYEILNLKDSVKVINSGSSTDKLQEMDAYFKKLEKGKTKPKNDFRKAEKVK